MKGHLRDLIKNYTIKYDRKIKEICSPLNNLLGIPYFSYYSIDENGHFVALSNVTDQIDFFFYHELYFSSPYLVHPNLLRSGTALIPATPEPKFLEQSISRYGIDHFLINISHLGKKIEVFLYTIKNLNGEKYKFLLNQMDLLNKFNRYFKREAQWLINRALGDEYNLFKAKGNEFLSRDPSLPLSSHDKNTTLFLKATNPLSIQEQKCLELFKQGKSAQSTGAILGLSRRTVEHYFESIKNKLNCQSKWDLLDA